MFLSNHVGSLSWSLSLGIFEEFCGFPYISYGLRSYVALVVKNPPAKAEMQEMWVWSLGWEDPLEEEMATHSSILCMGNPMERGTWWATVHGFTKSQTRLTTLLTLPYILIMQRKVPCIFSYHWKVRSVPDQTKILNTNIAQRNATKDNLMLYCRVGNVVVVPSLSCVPLCDPMDCSMPGFPVLHHLPELAQTHIYWVSDTIQPSHPLSSPSSVFNLSQLMSWLFTSDGKSIGSSASVLPINIQGWFHLGLTGLISLLSKGLSRVFSSTIVRRHQFFCTQPFLFSNSHIHTWLLEKL